MTVCKLRLANTCISSQLCHGCSAPVIIIAITFPEKTLFWIMTYSFWFFHNSQSIFENFVDNSLACCKILLHFRFRTSNIEFVFHS